jgi:hypothetical protein
MIPEVPHLSDEVMLWRSIVKAARHLLQALVLEDARIADGALDIVILYLFYVSFAGNGALAGTNT